MTRENKKSVLGFCLERSPYNLTRPICKDPNIISDLPAKEPSKHWLPVSFPAISPLPLLLPPPSRYSVSANRAFCFCVVGVVGKTFL